MLVWVVPLPNIHGEKRYRHRKDCTKQAHPSGGNGLQEKFNRLLRKDVPLVPKHGSSWKLRHPHGHMAWKGWP